MSYEFTSQPDIPVSVSALRDHCRVYGSDWDTQLTRAWYAAAGDIEKRSNVLLRPCSVRETLRGLSGLQGAELSVGPVDKASVQVTDADGNVLEGWRIDSSQVIPTICIDDRSAFERDVDYYINYTAGYSIIPNDLFVAALELTAHHFENREATTDRPLYAVPSSVWSIVANYGRAKV